MSVRRRVAVSVSTVLALVSCTLSAAAPAGALTTTTFSISATSVNDMLPVGNKLVVATGQATVLVRNLDGSAATSLPNMTGAQGLALDADGSDLFVGLPSGAVVDVETSTWTEKTRLPTDGVCPGPLVFAAEKLWFTDNCGGKVHSLDPGTGTVTATDAGGGWLLAIPGDTPGLLVGHPGLSPASVERYTISGTTLTQAASWSGHDETGGSNLNDMALDPDGLHVVLACGSPYEHIRLKLSDLTHDGSYASSYYPRAVATSSAAGGLVAAGVFAGSPEVSVYRAGLPVRQLDVGTSWLVPGGLAWSSDGSRLYAVTDDGLLHVFAGVELADAELTASGPSSAPVFSDVTVTGALSAGGSPVPSATLSVTSTSGGTTHPLPPVITGVDGSYSFTAPVGGATVRFTVQYAGDATYGPSAASVTVAPVKVATALSLTVPTTVVKRGTAYSISGALKGAGVGIGAATLTLVRTDLAGSRKVYVKTTSTGRFTLKDTPAVGGKVTWRATWPGTSRYATPAAVTRAVTVSRSNTSLSITTNTTTYAYGATATVKVHLGATYNNRVVSVFARKATTGTTTLLKTAKVSSTGYLVLSVPVTSKTVYSVKFAGDYRYLPDAASRSVGVNSKVTMAMSGYSGRSGSYYLVPRSGSMILTPKVLPSRAGGCVVMEAQANVSGVWRSTNQICATLDSASTGRVRYLGNGYPGLTRVRAYVGATSLAGAGSSPWVYVKFV